MQIACLIIIVVIIIYSLIKQYIDEKNEKKDNKSHKIDEFCNKNYKKIWVVFVIIIFFTVIYKFGEIPQYIGVDEAGMIYDAYCLEEYGTDRYMNSYPLYLINFGSGQSVLCAYLVTVCIKILGFNMIAFRLPTLLIYIISVITSYLMISKSKNKKTALLFTFLIITCPWNIFNARMALDCNLYAGLFMLDLYLMNKAKKNYQYFIAGISIGITLYTYCLSWITMPFFLLIWIIYMLYLKKIKLKQIIILGIPIMFFAFPLIYFLLLNYGIVTQKEFWIFSVPILVDFRSGQINIYNIYRTGLESIKTIFFNNETIYYMYIPLFFYGYILEFGRAIKEVKSKEYGISTIMVIAFSTLFLGLLTTRIPSANKANVLFIPILYFVCISILEICRKSEQLIIIIILLIVSITVHYEYLYYSSEGINIQNFYQDKYLYSITKELERNDEYKDIQKYVLAYTSQPPIYTLLELKLSPEEYKNEVETLKLVGGYEIVRKVENYNYLYERNEIKIIDLTKEEYIFIINNIYEGEIKYLESNGYNTRDFGYYKILTKQKSEN